jgi:hypothetical protein
MLETRIVDILRDVPVLVTLALLLISLVALVNTVDYGTHNKAENYTHTQIIILW